MISIPIRALLDDKDYDLKLEQAGGGSGLGKKINIPQIQKPGLALTGDPSNLHPGRVQILGNSEVNYLKSLPPAKRKTNLRKICRTGIACLILTHNNRPPPPLEEEARRAGVPLLRTPVATATFIIRVTQFLEAKLTESTNAHGVLIDVFGVGILLLGKSGIGKSECALELIMKGHRLVSDDIVHIYKKAPSSLYGTGSELVKYHMEVRGLGIINIKDLFGVTSVRDQKLIELVIELVEWHPKAEYERLGVIEQTHRILNVDVPYLKIPIRPGRSLANIIEVAARNQLLKLKGFYSAQEFQEKLTSELLASEGGKHRLRQLLE